jgi:hypothetical protein
MFSSLTGSRVQPRHAFPAAAWASAALFGRAACTPACMGRTAAACSSGAVSCCRCRHSTLNCEMDAEFIQVAYMRILSWGLFTLVYLIVK